MAVRTGWRGTSFGAFAGALVAGIGVIIPVQFISILLVSGGLTGMIASAAQRVLRPKGVIVTALVSFIIAFGGT
jgi:hypothetical protein